MSSVKFIGDALTEKPWGSEYLLCRSSSSALWCLLMHQDASTSFHCHPIKRTGYVVLQGEVMVEFLSSTRKLGAGEFINFRPGLFHKTTALQNQTVVLEIESPDCKQDLVRLEDSAGRVSSRIEAPLPKLNQNQLFMIDNFRAVFDGVTSVPICGLGVSLRYFGHLEDCFKEDGSLAFLMVLEGEVRTNDTYLMEKPQRLLGPGDVIGVRNLMRMRHVIDETAFDISGILFEQNYGVKS